jgi:hypothetical protein
MNRLIQIITSAVDRKHNQDSSRGSRRSVAYRPGLEGMEQRLSLSAMGVSSMAGVQPVVIAARMPISIKPST